MILGGDVGGTKTRLGLFEVAAGGGVGSLVREETLPSAEFADFASLLGRFLGGDARAVRAACFGVPGPVAGDRLVEPLPNLLFWGTIDGTRPLPLPGGGELPSFGLLNDLAATAEGLPALTERELATLHPGEPESSSPGNQVLIAAGTGLGMAFLPWIDGRRAAVASEGGHVDFAPRDEQEAALLHYLRRALRKPGDEELRRVSVERVVSGPGLLHIYRFLCERHGRPGAPQVEEAIAAGEDPVPLISEAALSGTCTICRQSLETFVSLYGAAAGNLALLGTAAGGVFLGGGISPKILPLLKSETFLDAFFDKGRLEGYLRRIPVRVILNSGTALLGAARAAAARLAHRAGRV